MRRLLPVAVLLTLSGLQPQAAPAQPTIEQTMAEVRAYLDQYRREMAFVIADERTTQRIMRQTPVVKGARSTSSLSTSIRRGGPTATSSASTTSRSRATPI
jgi:hypothetical protein